MQTSARVSTATPPLLSTSAVPLQGAAGSAGSSARQEPSAFTGQYTSAAAEPQCTVSCEASGAASKPHSSMGWSRCSTIWEPKTLLKRAVAAPAPGSAASSSATATSGAMGRQMPAATTPALPAP